MCLWALQRLAQVSLELPDSLSHSVIIEFNTAHCRKNTRYAQQKLVLICEYAVAASRVLPDKYYYHYTLTRVTHLSGLMHTLFLCSYTCIPVCWISAEWQAKISLLSPHLFKPGLSGKMAHSTPFILFSWIKSTFYASKALSFISEVGQFLPWPTVLDLFLQQSSTFLQLVQMKQQVCSSPEITQRHISYSLQTFFLFVFFHLFLSYY